MKKRKLRNKTKKDNGLYLEVPFNIIAIIFPKPPRRTPHHPFKRRTERTFRLISHRQGNFRNRQPRMGQVVVRKQHPPAGQIGYRRDANEVAELGGKGLA